MNLSFNKVKGQLTWDAHPNNQGTQAGVAAYIIGMHVAGSEHHPPIPAVLPRGRFGVTAPGSELVGAGVLSRCKDPGASHIQESTVGTES